MSTVGMSDRLERLIAAAFACTKCGKEHVERDISQPGRIGHNGQPIKQYTWGDPTDGHAYYKPTIDTYWIREWAAANPLEGAS